MLTRSSPAEAGLLAFAAYRHGNADIYVMRSDGSGEQRLTRDAGEDLFPVWSPDGRRIAFTRIRGGFACDPENDLLAAAQMVRIPFVDLALGCMPKRLGSIETFVMNADGSDRRKLATGLGAAWSPDGRRIAYLRLLPKHVSEIYVVGIDGRDRHRLTRIRAVADLPSWSPDGRLLAFDSERASPDTLEHRLYVVSADGRGLRQVVPGSQEGSTEPAWSPDGTKIAFSNWEGAISTIQPDGTHPRALRSKTRGLSSESDGYPAWSPDGRKLAFVVLDSDNGRRHVAVVNADGTGLHELAGVQLAPIEKASWSADSSLIVVSAAGKVTVVDAGRTDRRVLGRPGSGMPAWQPGRR